MIKTVTLTNFRGLAELEVPLSNVTILTGVNGVGKTSVLEGLFCLFSESRLDVSPLSRANKTVNTAYATPAPFYNYRLFWDECPLFGKRECTVRAAFDDGRKWEWSYRKANLSEISKELFVNNPMAMDASTEFAELTWRATGCEDYTRVQVLGKYPGLYLLPMEAQAVSYCSYIDFASFQLQLQKLSFKNAKRLRAALQILNPRSTDVRLKDFEVGLTVILDDEIEASLGTIGNGAVAWANTLITIFNIAESLQENGLTDLPTVILIDEIGAGIHYSIMLDIWKFFCEFANQNPHMQFVFTSHSDDCIKAFCQAFMERDGASVVSLHRTSVGSLIVPTEYRKEYFETIRAGEWEVRG